MWLAIWALIERWLIGEPKHEWHDIWDDDE